MVAGIGDWLKGAGRRGRRKLYNDQRKAKRGAAFIDRFLANYENVDLVRIGGGGDGGYLVPDILDGISHCFSPGVSEVAEFEAELAERYGITSFMADASVDKSPIAHDKLKFSKRFIGSSTSEDFLTLGEWMEMSLDGSERGLLLQMDIEGGEFDVLAYEDADLFARFSVILIELHGMNRIFDKHFNTFIRAAFEKLYRNFVVCHVHPNNAATFATCEGVEVPKVIEVSLLRRDSLASVRREGAVVLPHPLDAPNVSGKDDIKMPEAWWKAQTQT